MKGRLFALFAVALAAHGALACKEDPTTSLAGTPTLLLVNPNPLFLNEGVSGTIEATVFDEQLTSLRATIAATSPAPGVATVTPDNTTPDPAGRRQLFTVSALTPGQSVLNVTGGGLSSQATVNVMPLVFGGALSTTTPQVGQEFTLQSTSVLKFTSGSNVDFGGGIRGVVINQTADVLTVRVPQPDAPQPGPVTVDSVNVTYVPGLRASLPTPTVNVQNPFGNNSAPYPADPDANIAVTGGGAPIVLYDGFTTAQADNFYVLNLAATTTFTVLLEWSTAADLDILYCVATCSAGAHFVGNFDGATGDNPEVSTVTLAAGSYNLYINAFDNHDEPSHLYKITITPQ